MKGWYVIPTNEDIIEFTGRGSKNKALSKAKELFNKGDLEVFIQQFDDDDPDGFCASGKTIFINEGGY